MDRRGAVRSVLLAALVLAAAGFVALGGTVVVSSHSMDLVERMCDHVAIIANGRVLAAGTLDAVRAGRSLEDRFLELVGGRRARQGPEWLRPS